MCVCVRVCASALFFILYHPECTCCTPRAPPGGLHLLKTLAGAPTHTNTHALTRRSRTRGVYATHAVLCWHTTSTQLLCEQGACRKDHAPVFACPEIHYWGMMQWTDGHTKWLFCRARCANLCTCCSFVLQHITNTPCLLSIPLPHAHTHTMIIIICTPELLMPHSHTCSWPLLLWLRGS